MFNLNTASIGIRKAAALAGIRSGKFEPVFDQKTGPDAIVARVIATNGTEITITSGDQVYAEAQTWEEINR